MLPTRNSALPFVIAGLAALGGLWTCCAADWGAQAVENATPLDARADSVLNEEIIDVIRTMPQGGGYRASGPAFTQLARSISVDPVGRLDVRAQFAQPSFCSGATFLVFVAVLEQMERTGRLRLSPEAAKALLVHGQPDGTGVWGRWNANGPGTARLFFESGLGRNFTSFDEARPGDFMKVWWNDNIGSTEHGHSVVYLGTSVGEKGEPTVSFWSSNVPGGFGVRAVAKAKIKRALFSRLENVQAINRVTALPPVDPYLAAMLRRPSSPAEMFKLVGVQGSRADGN